MAFCTSPLSEQECHNDTSCIYLEEKSYHPFSILNEDGVGVKVEDDSCPGAYEKNKKLEQYIEKCLKKIPSIFPGNNSMNLQSSSPKYASGIYKHCWDCAQAENFDICFVSKLNNGQMNTSIHDPLTEKMFREQMNLDECTCNFKWAFVRKDGEAKDFYECDKTIVDFDDTTTLPWCYTNKSCKHARKGQSGQYWNYCTPPRNTSSNKEKPNPCLCKPFWKHNGEWYSGCDSRHPDRDRTWCYIGSNTCPTANDPFGEAWVYCDSKTKQEEIVSREFRCSNGIAKLSSNFDYTQPIQKCEICDDEYELVKETFKNKETTRCKLKEVNTVVGQGRGYRGFLNTTKSGRVCQSWDKSEPHGHNHGFQYETIGHNFCRNPDNSESIWCYTNDPIKRREYCDIKEANKQQDNESFYDGDAWSDKLLDFEFSDESTTLDTLCKEIGGSWSDCNACGTKLYFNQKEISTNNLNSCLVTRFFNKLKDKVFLPKFTDEDEKCKCKDTWLYNDNEYFGCDERMPNESSPWCYVDEACQTARRSKSGKFWKYCQLDNDPCTCKKQWSYEGELFSGCDERKPGKDDSWCVVDGFSCPTAKQEGNQFWTFCTPEKSNACNCQASWSHKNQTYSLCGAVEEDKKWCFVNDVACETTDGTKDAKPFKFCTEIGGECTDDSTCALGSCKTNCCKIAAANDKNCEECDANGNCGKCVEDFVYKEGEGCVSKYQNKCTNGFKNIPAQKDGEDCQSCKYGYVKEGDTCIHEITHDHVKGVGTGYRGILNIYNDAEYITQECNPWNLYENTKDLEHNFYRNPDNDPKGVWCYTKKGQKIYPRKSDLLNFYEVVEEKGIHYNGNINTTLTGRSCARWNDNSVHEHDVETSFQHNFCRNPNGEKDTIWCYTNDKEVPWEYCTVPDDVADDRVYFEKFHLLPNRHCFGNDRVFATMKKFGSNIPVAECIKKCTNSETCKGITYDENVCMLCTNTVQRYVEYKKDSIVYEKLESDCKSNADCKEKDLPNCIKDKEKNFIFRFGRCSDQNFDTDTFCESHNDCGKREFCQTNNLCNNVVLCYANSNNSITGECPKECETHTDCEGNKFCSVNFECNENRGCISSVSIDSTCPNECESHNDCGWPKEDQVCLEDGVSSNKRKMCTKRILSCETMDNDNIEINDKCPECSSHDDCSKASYCSTKGKCVSHNLCSYSDSMLKPFDNNCSQKPKECESHEDCGWPDKDEYCTNEYECKNKWLCDKNDALNNQCPRECESHEDCGWPDKDEYCNKKYECKPKFLCKTEDALNNQCPRECESHKDCGKDKFCNLEYVCKNKFSCDTTSSLNSDKPVDNQCPKECENDDDCGDAEKYCDSTNKCQKKSGNKRGLKETIKVPEKECESHKECGWPETEKYCNTKNKCDDNIFCSVMNDAIDDLCPIKTVEKECESHTECGWPGVEKYCNTKNKCSDNMFCSIMNDAIDEICPIKTAKECESHTDCGWPAVEKYCTKDFSCKNHVMCSIYDNAVDGKCPKECESHRDCGWPEVKKYCNTKNKCDDNTFCSHFNDAIDQTCPKTKANEIIVETVDVKEDKKEGECNSHEACGWPDEEKYCTKELSCNFHFLCSIYDNAVDGKCPISKQCHSHEDCGWPASDKYCTSEMKCENLLFCSIYNNSIDEICH